MLLAEPYIDTTKCQNFFLNVCGRDNGQVEVYHAKTLMQKLLLNAASHTLLTCTSRLYWTETRGAPV